MVRRALIAVALLLLAAPAAAQAASVTVTTTADGDHGSCTVATCTLRDAVKYSSADTVVLPARVAHYAVPSTSIPIARPVTIQGAGATKSVIDAASPGQHRIFELTAFPNASTSTVTFRGVTIENAFTTDPPGGAGILVDSGGPNLTLVNSAVTNNLTHITSGSVLHDSGGGGIHNAGSSTTTLQGASVTHNTANVDLGDLGCCNGGGGLYVEAGKLAIGARSHVDDNNVTVTEESPDMASPDSGGGGIFDESSAGATIANSTVSRNEATVNGSMCCYGGGGMYFDSFTNTTPDTLTNVTVAGNTATVTGTPTPESGHGGGGIYTNDGIAVTGGAITGNTATVKSAKCCHGGGGVYLDSGSGPSSFIRVALTGNRANVDADGCCSGGGAIQIDTAAAPFALRSSLVSGNRVTIKGGATESGGGGVYDDSGADHPDVYQNSTIAGNSTDPAGAGMGGGGLYVFTLSPTITRIANMTIAGNSAPSGNGGGILNLSSRVESRNSIIGQNNAPSGANCASFTAPSSPAPVYSSAGFNLTNTAAACGLTGAGDRVVAPAAMHLGPLAANGGGTLTRALFAGSPAINGGNPTGCKDSSGVPIKTDQRGVPRPFGKRCDIGAFEAQVPRDGGLTVKPAAFRVPPGATVGYSDSLAGTTTLTVARCVKRRAGKCKRYNDVGKLVHRDRAGKNSVHLGRIAGKSLKPGRYRISAVPRLYGIAGKTVRTPFRVLKPA